MKVRLRVGRHAGEVVDLPYAIATANVANGTAALPDTPVFINGKQYPEGADTPKPAAASKPWPTLRYMPDGVEQIKIRKATGGLVFVLPKWPEFSAVMSDIFDVPGFEIAKDIVYVTTINASATYRVFGERSNVLYLELIEGTVSWTPVEVPSDWRELHHLKRVALAKKIAPEFDGKMTADAANGIIEKYLADNA